MQQEINNLKYPFPIKQQVIWGEMDAFNHINNVIYFRYFETGRIHFFNEANLWQLFIEEDIRIVVGKLECNYLKEVTFPSEIEIAVAIKKIGNASLTVHQKVTCNGEIVAHGDAIIVATNQKLGKSMPWSNKMRVAFGKWL